MNPKSNADQPIGIFDSGVGGLSVAREIHTLLPAERLEYFADCVNAPWGVRSSAEIRELASAATQRLLHMGAKIIVVACNTASVHALQHLRSTFAHVQFVGMHPAVKPAAQLTKSRRICVLATAATARAEILAELTREFVTPLGVEIEVAVPRGLVQQVEKGELHGQETMRILRECLEPMLEAGVDTIVLGCTHFPFVREAIQRVAGSEVQLVDPAPAVARQCRLVMQQLGLANDSLGSDLLIYEGLRITTTGEPGEVARTVEHLLELDAGVGLRMVKGV
jgi:glutamate racemase